MTKRSKKPVARTDQAHGGEMFLVIGAVIGICTAFALGATLAGL